jgi:hypothetical protein
VAKKDAMVAAGYLKGRLAGLAEGEAPAEGPQAAVPQRPALPVAAAVAAFESRPQVAPGQQQVPAKGPPQLQSPRPLQQPQVYGGSRSTPGSLPSSQQQAQQPQQLQGSVGVPLRSSSGGSLVASVIASLTSHASGGPPASATPPAELLRRQRLRRSGSPRLALQQGHLGQPEPSEQASSL